MSRYNTFARDAAQLAGQTPQGDILSRDSALLLTLQFLNVRVDGVIETQTSRYMLVQHTKVRERLGDARNAIQSVAADLGDVVSQRVAHVRRVVVRPQQLLRRGDFDREARGYVFWGSDLGGESGINKGKDAL